MTRENPKYQDPVDHLKSRYEQLLAGHGATVRLSTAVGISRQQLHKIWGGRSGLPEWLVVVVELLERLPPAEWPDRWQSVMEKRMQLEKQEIIMQRISIAAASIRLERSSNGELPAELWSECAQIVRDARQLLTEDGKPFPWESDDLDYAEMLIDRRTMPMLALATIERAMTVSEQRANGEMPSSHYDEQARRLSNRQASPSSR